MVSVISAVFQLLDSANTKTKMMMDIVTSVVVKLMLKKAETTLVIKAAEVPVAATKAAEIPVAVAPAEVATKVVAVTLAAADPAEEEILQLFHQ